jgi:four helix bundle suffix protein
MHNFIHRLQIQAEQSLLSLQRIARDSGQPEKVRALARNTLSDLARHPVFTPPPKGGAGGPILPAHGGFRHLKSYRNAEIVHDATVVFCNRFISPRSRTRDQMVQAARSGKQNIAEGSAASGTSKKFELKLMGVARASLEELLLDYQDYLRQHNLELWGKEHPEMQKIRKMAYLQNTSYRTYRTYFEKSPALLAANTAICLIHQTNYLLNKLIARLEQDFVRQGGLTERLYRARTHHRGR